ncbi:unnamed protein product, partial [Phaeothamnion confervicola]
RFDPDVRKRADGVVAATVEMFQEISENLLPTPSKFHYAFNLRDVSKVFQGVLMMTAARCPTPDVLARLWVHESERVFCDRLTDAEDRKWFQNLTIQLLSKHLRFPWTAEEVFGDEGTTEAGGEVGSGGDSSGVGSAAGSTSGNGGGSIVFCDFLKPGVEKKLYEESRDAVKLQALLSDAMDEYNVNFANQLNLVFFADAVSHVCRISRILRQPRGNAMLVGVGGSGKQSLTRIAAFVAGFDCVQIEIRRGYGLEEFREDLRGLMRQAGVGGKDTVFLCTDTQIIAEAMLEDINNILNSGEVPNLFAPDEVDKLAADMRPVLQEEAAAAGAVSSAVMRDACLQAFVRRVRDKLHVVLCMSPVGDALRIRCRNFPSLINCTTIDWFFPWPAAALASVANRFVANVPLPDETARAGLVRMCAVIHTSIAAEATRFYQQLRRRVYTTPKSFLDLIGSYTETLGRLRASVEARATQMEAGVRKLDETNAMVGGLQADLTQLEPILEEKTKAAATLLAQVEIDTREAALVKDKVSTEEAEVGRQAAEVSAVQADAQRELDVALPALEEALKALDALTKNDITEVKSFAKPPPAVQTVMEAVCVLMEAKPDWDASKKLLAEGNFLERLRGYDRDNIKEGVLRKLRPYVENPNMQAGLVEVVKKVSKAATGLCMFVHAMDMYSRVAKEVEPKKQRVEQMNKILAAANATLATKQAELQAVVDRVAALEAQCVATLAEKRQLEDDAETTARRLERAEKLTSGLASEGQRWRQTLEELGRRRLEIVGDAFLACACVSYYGPFTGPFRDRLVTSWTERAAAEGLPLGRNFSLAGTLGSAAEVLEWHSCLLPTDRVSTDSAVLVTKGQRWPLMIDPQGQANRWGSGSGGIQSLTVVDMGDPDLLRALDACVRIGGALLVEGVGETVEPALEPVLLRATFKRGNRLLIRIGDGDVDYDPAFRLYLTTKMPNPHYLPEVCIKVNVINFTVTTEGLVDQLLGQVVARERPDVERRKAQLLLRMAADRRQLQDLEAKILELLSKSEGNVLDDQRLIDALADAKTTSAVIADRVAEAERTEKDIDRARNEYVPAATRATIIYFVVADLAAVDPMYQHSLQYYQTLFDRCVEASEPSTDISTRLANLIAYSTRAIYENICRGLFEKDKILFSALICFQILRERGDIGPAEWPLFLRGAGTVDRAAVPPNPAPRRLSEQAWDLLYTAEHRIPAAGAAAAAAVANAPTAGVASGDAGAPGVAKPVGDATHSSGSGGHGAKKDIRPSRTSTDGAGHGAGGVKHHGKGSTRRHSAADDAAAALLAAVEATGPRPLAGLCAHITEHWEAWNAWADAPNPVDAPLPGNFQAAASAFQRLLLVKAFREDQLLRAVVTFVGRQLGPEFAKSPQATMEDIYRDLDCRTPCIFVLSKGADPTAVLLRFARKAGRADRLSVVSLGQGQGPFAAQLIERAARSGDWVLLQNCMLARSWMPKLEKIVRELAEADAPTHPEFRLFLTSAPASYFPVSVLQGGVKMTNEPPRGVRANALRSFSTLVKAEDWESGARPAAFQRMLVGLLFFHANVQERRKFGPLGWNISYAFDESDLETSIAVLRRFLNEPGEPGAIPWDALRYVTGQINYGGRVTDDWDRRCLMSVLGIYFAEGVLKSDGYRFSRGGEYYAPRPGPHAAIASYLDGLPATDDPELFGMHDNADVAFRAGESAALMAAVLALQPRESSGGGGRGPDDIVTELAEAIAAQMPPLLDEDEAGPTTFAPPPMSPALAAAAAAVATAAVAAGAGGSAGAAAGAGAGAAHVGPVLRTSAFDAGGHGGGGHGGSRRGNSVSGGHGTSVSNG